MSATPPETSLPYDRALGVDALLRRSGWSAAGTLARSRIDSFRCLPVVAGRLDPFARQGDGEVHGCEDSRLPPQSLFTVLACARRPLRDWARSSESKQQGRRGRFDATPAAVTRSATARRGGILGVARRAPPVRGQDRVHLTSLITYEGSNEPPSPDVRGPGIRQGGSSCRSGNFQPIRTLVN
jgi:hypothetical protein